MADDTHIDELVAQWRASTLDPADADRDACRLVQRMAAHTLVAARLKGWDRVVADIGHETGLAEALGRRLAAKATHDLRQELLAELARLRARVAVLETERPITIEEPRALRVVVPAS